MSRAELKDHASVFNNDASSPTGTQNERMGQPGQIDTVCFAPFKPNGLVPLLLRESVDATFRSATQRQRGKRILDAMTQTGVRQSAGEDNSGTAAAESSTHPAGNKGASAIKLFVFNGQFIDAASLVAQGTPDGSAGPSDGTDDIRKAIGNGDNAKRDHRGGPPDGKPPRVDRIEGDDPRGRDRAHYAFAWMDAYTTRRNVVAIVGEPLRPDVETMLDAVYDTATLDITVQNLGPLVGQEKWRIKPPDEATDVESSGSNLTVGIIDRPDALPNGYVTHSLIGRSNQVDIIGDLFDPVRREEIEGMTREYIHGSGNVQVTTLSATQASDKKYDLLIWRDQPNVGNEIDPMQPESDVIGISNKIHEVLGLLSPNGQLVISAEKASLEAIREEAKRIEYRYDVFVVQSAVVNANAMNSKVGMPREWDYTHQTIIIRPKSNV